MENKNGRMTVLRRMERRRILLLKEIRVGRGDAAYADALREGLEDDFYVNASASRLIFDLERDLNAVFHGDPDEEARFNETQDSCHKAALDYATKWRERGFSRAACVFEGVAHRIAAKGSA